MYGILWRRINVNWCLGLEMDATKMTFPDCKFDVVIDKGTLDAIMVIFLIGKK